MPAYELIKEEQAAAKRAAKALGKTVKEEMSVPSIPHVLPFTRWCVLLSPCPCQRLGWSPIGRCAVSGIPGYIGELWPFMHTVGNACYLLLSSDAAREKM